MSPVLFWVPLMVVGTAVAALAAYVWSCRPAPSAATLTGLLGGVALWCLTYGMELRAGTVAAKVFWVGMQEPAICSLPVLFLLLVLEYTGRPPRKRTVAALFALPLLTLAINWTDRYHHLYWRSVWLDTSGPIPVLGREYGPGLWLYVAYAYTMLALAALYLFRFLLRRDNRQRSQTAVLLGSMLLPALSNVAYVFDATSVKFLDGTPFGFAATGIGITLVLFRYRFQAIVPVAWKTVVESIPESVIVLDRQGRVAGLNKAAEQLLACTGEQCVGKTPAAALEHRPELIPLSKGKPHVERDLTMQVDGTERVFEVETLGVDRRSGTSIGRVLKLRDVTRERQAALELAASREQAEAATAAKSQFLAHMSHEIRTPLNGIIGMSALLAELPLAPPAAEYAGTIHVAARGLLAIINDTLDFAKIEAGKFELERAAFDLEKCLSEAVRLMEWSAQDKGLRLCFRYPEQAPRHVLGDSTRLRQVALNLLGNAVKFTSAGEVSLAVECPECSETRSRFLISVRDTGIGIPAEKLATLFREFSQADASVGRKYGGTGLGLAISRQLVERMGGTIRVESREGEGSCFTADIALELDPDPDAARSAESSPPQRREFPGSRILLAEDNPVNQRLGLRLLERLGCAVDVAADGWEAVQQAGENTYDLIFMDCQMPRVDGFEATARIRARGIKTPIVALTASATEETRRACLEIGMNDYVAKPVEPDVWSRVLERWL